MDGADRRRVGGDRPVAGRGGRAGRRRRGDADRDLQKLVTEVRRFRTEQGIPDSRRVAARLVGVVRRRSRDGAAVAGPAGRAGRRVRADRHGRGRAVRRRRARRARHLGGDRRRRRAGPAGPRSGRGAEGARRRREEAGQPEVRGEGARRRSSTASAGAGRPRSRTSSGSRRGWRRCRREPGRRRVRRPDFGGGDRRLDRIRTDERIPGAAEEPPEGEGPVRGPGGGRRGRRAAARSRRRPRRRQPGRRAGQLVGGRVRGVPRRRGGARQALARDEDGAVARADRRSRRAARRSAARLPRRAPDRHQRQDVHGAHGRRAAQRDRAAHRPLHQPAPAERHRADQHRQPADHAGALRRGLPRRGAVRRPGRRPPRAFR